MMEMVDVKNVTKIVPSITRKRILIVFFIPLSCLIQNLLLLFLTAPRYILLIPHSSQPSNNVQCIYLFFIFKFNFDAYHLNKLTQNDTHALTICYHLKHSKSPPNVDGTDACSSSSPSTSCSVTRKALLLRTEMRFGGRNRWGHCPRDHISFTLVNIFEFWLPNEKYGYHLSIDEPKTPCSTYYGPTPFVHFPSCLD